MENETDVPTGQLYSRLYLEGPTEQQDSEVARNRIAAHIGELDYVTTDKIEASIAKELGIVSPPPSRVSYFIINGELAQFLNVITLSIRHIARSGECGRTHPQRDFIRAIGRIFREENLPYRVDSLGGIHPLVDEIFDKERVSIIKGLDKADYKASKNSMNAAYESLKLDGTGTLQVVRLSFDALENVFKVKFGTSRLGATEINKKLTPILVEIYTGRALDAARLMADSFSKFVNSAHQYRHEDDNPEPTPPSIEYSILFISQASSFLRWLLSLPISVDD